MIADQSEQLRKRVAQDCRILYGGADYACWECHSGCDDILERLSYKLEALNIQFYKKWKVKVIASQVKEKYATLRFYFCCFIDSKKDPTREQEVLLRHVEILADEYVRQAEQECYNVCEFCGTQIGTKENPRCSTLGWYRYLCRECALKSNGDAPARYEMNGKYYEGRKRIANPFKKKAGSK